MTKDADTRAQETHWVCGRCCLDNCCELINDGLLHGAHALDFVAECSELCVGWLVANQDEVRNAFKGGLLGKVGNLVAAIDEFGLRDGADLRLADHLVGESTRVDRLGSWNRNCWGGSDHGF